MLEKTRLALAATITLAIWACAPSAAYGTSEPTSEDAVTEEDEAAPKSKSTATSSSSSAPTTTSGSPATTAETDDDADGDDDDGDDADDDDGDDDDGDDGDACYAKCEAADPGAWAVLEPLSETMYDCICGGACANECGTTEYCSEDGTPVPDDEDDPCNRCWASAKATQCQTAFTTACGKDATCKRAQACFLACEEE